MKITAGILFYLLNRDSEMQHICHGADRMILRRSEHFRNQTETESGVLYIYADKKGVLLFCTEKRQKTGTILQKAFRESDGPFSSLWIPYENLEDASGQSRHLADEVSEYIVQIWNYFTQVQNEILESILTQESIESIMKKVRGLLRKPFVIVDRDMLLLYCHPDVPQLMEAAYGPGYQEEISQELLTAKEFHEVAKKREPFYYQLQNFDHGSFCINIVIDGYYYARLVVYVDKGEEKLPSGAEQITEYLATVMEQIIRSGVLQLHRSQNDLLHGLCAKLLEGGEIKSSEIKEAILSYHWDTSDVCQVICLKPHLATGWDTQIENTMPTMIRKLEQTWHHSCAVFSGTTILWLVNRTMSENQTNPRALSQDLMVLLRENLFRAGESSLFKDAALLPSAMKEAEEALRIGTQKEPNYWYYRFDDCRMDFMLEAIREKAIEPRLLIHPAISVLLEHDRIHESELSETLRMFLEKRQNVTQAAEALFIHRTTLFRRLNQVKELTGLDFDNDDLMFELQLSYRILDA